MKITIMASLNNRDVHERFYLLMHKIRSNQFGRINMMVFINEMGITKMYNH